MCVYDESFILIKRVLLIINQTQMEYWYNTVVINESAY